MATIKKTIKKAQNGKSVDSDVPSWASKASKQILTEQKNPKLGDIRRAKEDSTMKSNFAKGRAIERADKIKEGYKVEDTANGTVYTAPAKKRLKSGGKITKKGSVSAGTKAPAKRVGPIDPKGAYTKVQTRTIAKAKAPAPKLVKDKQLGATKMKMGGKTKK